MIKLPNYLKMEMKLAEIMTTQASYGVFFDKEKAEEYVTLLEDRIIDIDDKLRPLLPFVDKKIGKPIKKYKLKNGEYTASFQKWIDNGGSFLTLPDGTRQKIMKIAIDPNSATQLKDYLLKEGWKPEKWNYKKIKNEHGRIIFARDDKKQLIPLSPKLPKEADEIERLEKRYKSPAFKLIAKRMEARHRLSTILGYLSKLRSDGRIAARAIQCGAITHRMTHVDVANLVGVEKYFGKELRGLFKASPGKVLVGCDASKLELRLIAHYVEDYNFTYQLLHGDIKNLFLDILKDFVSNYTQAKAIVYALCYGAQDFKLGTMAMAKPGEEKATGKAIRDQIGTVLPGLDNIITKCVKWHETRGWVPGIDGRRIYTVSKHGSFNSLVQSTGGILMKWASVRANQTIKKRGIPAVQVIHYHDEYEFETLPEYAEEVGKILVDSIKEVGEYFKLNIALDGEYAIGVSWADVH